MKICSLREWEQIAKPILAELDLSASEIVIKSSDFCCDDKIVPCIQIRVQQDKIAESIAELKAEILRLAPSATSVKVYVFNIRKILLEFDLFESPLSMLQNMAPAMLSASYAMTCFFN